MTVASEITRIQCAKSDIRQAIIDKGVDVGASLTIDEYAACILDIPTGPKSGLIDVLVVGGGGGGGGGITGGGTAFGGGGGGAGGFVECYSIPINCASYTITVGGGGVMHTKGGDSCFDNIIAYGGGSGGVNGGSGGGGTYTYNGYGPGAGCPGQGNAGGEHTGYNVSGGGGGGAGSAGCSVNGDTVGGDGGAGKCSCISGSCQRYSAGGGGGGAYGKIGGIGGQGGGGDGNKTGNGDGCDATTYGSGGGGRGGSNPNAGATSGCGYQGIVIIRYKTDGSCGISCNSLGGCKYACGDYTIHCFTEIGERGFIPVYK